MAYILYYILLILVIVTVWINKSKLLTIYFSLFFICDFSNWFRQQFTHYPKPYQGTGFILFALTTCLYLAIPMWTALASFYSFEKRIAPLPVICWASVSVGLLYLYPEIRGQSLLNSFYAYGITFGGANLIYLLTKIKQKFSFTQGTLFLAVLGSLICYLVAILEINLENLQNWILIAYCNCIFYIGVIVASWINRFVKRLSP